MKMLSAFWFSLRALLGRDRVGTDIDDELAFHLERETRMLEQEGMSPAAARREATVRFGGVQRYREEVRDVRRVSWLEDLRTDVRFALRLARHHPGFSANVILISALGIAACVTTFSLISGILLAPLPFPEADRVLSLDLRTANVLTGSVPAETYRRLAAESSLFDGVTTTDATEATVDFNGEPSRLHLGAVTASFFRVYRIRPIIGRAFVEDEAANRTPVLLLGHDEWLNRYAGDRRVVGRQIRLDGVPHTIIGVMPPRFLGNFQANRFVPAMWVPLRIDESVAKRGLNPIVRLADGVSRDRAEAWLKAAVHVRMPASVAMIDSAVGTPSLVPESERLIGSYKRPLWILLGAVLLVLLLVSANIATMFLARSAVRGGEMGVRQALGASAGRQLRQLITESGTLTAIGGVIGVALSLVTISVIRKLGTGVLPRIDEIGLDWRVALFAVGGVIITGVAGGLAHALSSGLHRAAPKSDSTSGRVTSQRTSSLLVVAQIALSVVLLVGAGLLVKGFMRVAPRRPGYELQNRATLYVPSLAAAGVADSNHEGRRRLIGDMMEQMRRVPGVRDVGVTSFLPLTDRVAIAEVELSGRPAGNERLPGAFLYTISPNYFEVMGIARRLGRTFTPLDRDGTERAAIVNETAAARWWPGVNPIGRQVTLRTRFGRDLVTIVGVVGDSRQMGDDTRIRTEIYVPVAQSAVRAVSFVAATTVDPRSVLPGLQRALHAIAPRIPIEDSSDMATMAFESVSTARFFSVVMSAFAIAAVLLSALGVYGLLSFAVVQRKREIGIRVALGATSVRIGRLVVSRALAIGFIGVAVGATIAFALSRYMESLLLEVTATDREVFTLAALVVFAVAVLAACAPTYQAVRVDPIKSLRT